MLKIKQLEQYNKQLTEATRLIERAKLKNEDVVFDPIEMVPMPFSTFGNSNWAYKGLGIDVLLEKLYDKIKSNGRKVHCFIHDDADRWVHPFLEYAYDPSRSWNSTGNALDPRDNHSHMVAGSIFAYDGVRDLGIVARLVKEGYIISYVGKCMSLGSGSYTGINSSLAMPLDINIPSGEFAWHNGSFGGGGSSTLIEETIKKGQQKGHMYNFSAGNSGYSSTGSRVLFPAKLPNVAAIAAVDSNFNWKSYSSVGPEVDYTSASGVWTVTQNSEGNAEGTSFSSPIHTGVMMLLTLAYPEYAEKGQEYFYANIDKGLKDLGETGKDAYYGKGILIDSSWFNRSDEPVDDPKDDPIDDKPPVIAPPEYPSEQVFKMSVNAVMRPIWGRSGEPASETRTADLEIDVDVYSKVYAEFVTDKINQAFKEYFTSRGFLLRQQDDADAMLYWVAHFVEMMFPKMYYQKIVIARIKDKNTGIERTYPKKSTIAALINKQGVYTYKKNMKNSGISAKNLKSFKSDELVNRALRPD